MHSHEIIHRTRASEIAVKLKHRRDEITGRLPACPAAKTGRSLNQAGGRDIVFRGCPRSLSESAKQREPSRGHHGRGSLESGLRRRGAAFRHPSRQAIRTRHVPVSWLHDFDCVRILANGMLDGPYPGGGRAAHGGADFRSLGRTSSGHGTRSTVSNRRTPNVVAHRVVFSRKERNSLVFTQHVARAKVPEYVQQEFSLGS